MSEIDDVLNEYICMHILKRPKYNLGKNDPLITSGLIDSFHLVDLAVYVEEKFGIRIEDTELNSSTFDTIAQLSELILKRKNEKGVV